MAKVKVIKDSTISSERFFDNITSNTIFNFGGYSITGNFESEPFSQIGGSPFTKDISLEKLNITQKEAVMLDKSYLDYYGINIDYKDFTKRSLFGSAKDYIYGNIKSVIEKFPYSLFLDSRNGKSYTYYDFEYDLNNDKSVFKIPIISIKNPGVYTYHINSIDSEKNIVRYYQRFELKILGFDARYTILFIEPATETNNYLKITVRGNPFAILGGDIQGKVDYHILPKLDVYNKFISVLDGYSKYLMGNRKEDGTGYGIYLKKPYLNKNNEIRYINQEIVWPTSDGYNIDIDGTDYVIFKNNFLDIGNEYDKIKTNLIYRVLIPDSLKEYDYTDNKKIEKYSKITGYVFDVIKAFVDSIQYAYITRYNNTNTVSDKLLSRLSEMLGWEKFNILSDIDLMEELFSSDTMNSKTVKDINLELWKRILINTSYFWKNKGKRDAIINILTLIGIPEQFLNINEYVYIANGIINPETVNFNPETYNVKELPYTKDGYPNIIPNTEDYYFQMDGEVDGGGRYFDIFEDAGFTLSRSIDNEKVSTDNLPFYKNSFYIEDNRRILNTKEIDVTLDVIRGLEYDIYEYIVDVDIPNTSDSYAIPYAFVNIELPYESLNKYEFILPNVDYESRGDYEIRFNGILLNAPKKDGGNTNTNADYIINGNILTLINAPARKTYGDTITITFLNEKESPILGNELNYIVTRVSTINGGSKIVLPEQTNGGTIQLSLDGIVLTQTQSGVSGDYFVDNVGDIVITNGDIISYLSNTDTVQVAYIPYNANSMIAPINEIYKVHSYNTNKMYLDTTIDRFRYNLNYYFNTTNDLKILINGIGLTPEKDFILNSEKKNQILIKNFIKYGDVVSVFYLTGGDQDKNNILDKLYDLGDIENLSFIEFIEKISSELINPKNRKTITNFKGGWYPTLYKIYFDYYNRSKLSDDDLMKTRGYRFKELYSFLSKYDSYFTIFVDQLIPATAIRRKEGIEIRNSVFTKQKFAYKRGVYMGNIIEKSKDNVYTYSLDTEFMYLGNDGSLFKKRQFGFSDDIWWDDDTVCVEITQSQSNDGGYEIL